MAARYIRATGGNSNAAGTYESSPGANDSVPVPTSADDVFGVVGSGQFTVNAALVANSLQFNTASAYANTLTVNTSVSITLGSSAAPANNAALSFSAGMTVSLAALSPFVFVSTSATQLSVTTNGKSIPSTMTFGQSGGGGTWILQGNLTTTNTIYLISGILTTNNVTISTVQFQTTGSVARTLTCGSSSITISGANINSWNATGSNFTLNANTSTITITGNNPTFVGNGLTYNVLSFPSLVGELNVIGTNTFSSFSCVGSAATSNYIVMSNSNSIGTLTLTGNSAGINRLLVQSLNAGFAITLTVSSSISAANVDFRDIIGAGAANWDLSSISGNSGDCGGNSGITFTSAATQTLSGNQTSVNWSAAAWSGRVPLPQDPVLITATWGSASTLTVNVARIGKSLDFTGTTWSGTAFEWTKTTATTLYGSLTLVSGMSNTGTLTTFSFEWRAQVNTINDAGTPLSNPILFPLAVKRLSQISSGRTGIRTGGLL